MIETLKKILASKFSPVHLEVTDDSWKHAGHAQAGQTGSSHFSVTIVSDVFAGKSFLERHRAVYQGLNFNKDAGIHALAIKAYTSEEWNKKTGDKHNSS